MLYGSNCQMQIMICPIICIFLYYLFNSYIVLRFQKLLAQNKEGILSSWVESQAAKRQKLEGGLLHRVCKLFYSFYSDLLILEEAVGIVCVDLLDVSQRLIT